MHEQINKEIIQFNSFKIIHAYHNNIIVQGAYMLNDLKCYLKNI